jgi:hypothetical protein
MRGSPRRWLLPALAVLALAGCPYSSDNPLSDPAAASPDAQLIGTWKTQDPDTKEWVTLSFFPYGEHEMVAFTPGAAGDQPEAYRLFVTIIDGERFLNVRQLEQKGDAAAGADSGAWMFVNYRVTAEKRMILRVVDDELFPKEGLATAEELRAFLRGRLADPRLYMSGDGGTSEMTWERSGT